MECADFVIVGAGVFGISTALHLARRHPSKEILLVDRKRPNPGAASSDYNKIIRADYPDLIYTSLALEAVEAWKNDPVFKPYFHQDGLLLVEEFGMGRAALESFQALGHDSGAEIMDLDAAKAKFPAFKDAEWTGGTEAYFNPSGGWGEADGAVASAVKAAEEAGVSFVDATVAGLELAGDKSCKGIRVQSEGGSRTILAKEKTILCMGAHTAKFLADAAPQWDELQVEGRMVAAAAVQCTATYDEEEASKFEGMPCHLLGMWHTHGEVIPPLSGRLKFNCEVSFTNMEHHAGLGKLISVPPTAESKTSFGQDVPKGLKQEVGNVVKNVFGSHIRGLKIESYRMCWDSVSPNQDWIIDHHPHCKDLFVAGAGSFHAWKFLPVIGKCITQRLLGELDEERTAKWAWNRSNNGAANEMYIPTRDLKTIGTFEGWPKVVTRA